MKQISLLIVAVIIFLSACSNAPQRGSETGSTPAPVVVSKSTPVGKGGYLAGDGPGADAPANLEATPDAVPQAEPLHRYANRPYVALGKNYTPLTVLGNYKERGVASWYGKKFHGQPTSIGEKYDMYGMTAAHTTLPIPSYVRVTNLSNGKSVVVRVNDRGPFLHDRIIDLSYTAALKLGIIGKGSGAVEVESIVSDTAVITPINVEAVHSEPLTPETRTPETGTPAAATGLPVGGGGNVYLQLGSFKSQQGAEGFMARMRAEFEGSGKQVILYQKESDLVRVQVGPYTNQEEARAVADQVQSRLGFKPFISVH